MLGVAEARDVAAALQRYWDRREEAGVTFEAELAHIARPTPEALARIRSEVERLLGEAGGDAVLALSQQGRLERSLHAALGGRTDVRLHTLESTRYVSFQPVGHGGMGAVYM